MLDQANSTGLPQHVNNLHNAREIENQISRVSSHDDNSGNKSVNNVTPITIPPMEETKLLHKNSRHPPSSKYIDNATPGERHIRVLDDKKQREDSKKCLIVSSTQKPEGEKSNESYRWLCESCEEKIFYTYTEAAAHEKE